MSLKVKDKEGDFNLPLRAYCAFDDILESFENEEYKEVDEKSEIINQTFTESQRLLNQDLLPALMANEKFAKEIAPYMGLKTSFNLYKMGWRMQFGSSKQWAGLCSAEEHKQIFSGQSKNRNIYISIQFTKHDANWDVNFRETMLHEMAHAVIFEIFYFGLPENKIALLQKDPSHITSHGHGEFWNIVCGILTGKKGCEQFYTNAAFEESFKNYKYVCFNCNNEKFGNTANFANRCSRCGKSVVIEKNNE